MHRMFDMNHEERMQKLINDPHDMVQESIDGFAKCYSSIIATTPDKRVLKYVGAPQKGRVGIVTGGGAGHDPAFIGYIGKNMVDAVAVGDIFLPPTPENYYHAFKYANSGEGVVCIHGNYQTDIDSIAEALEYARKDGIEVRTVIAKDDVADAEADKRRGLAGEVLMWKVGGAAASLGMNLDEVARVAQKAADRTKSIGVGLASCIIPMIGRPNYQIAHGTMEFGIGHHGTSSEDTYKLKTADETVEMMLSAILKDDPLYACDEVAVIVSGLGNTMQIEQNIVFNHVYDLLLDRNVKVYWSMIGNYFTSLDMMGVTLTVMKLDEELKRLIDIPADSIALKRC